MKQLTKEQAIAFAESKSYENMSHREIAEFQINQKKLCMPFNIFHEAVEKTIERPVFTHEFGMNTEGIKTEIMKGKEAPSFEDIINLIPKDKLIVAVYTKGEMMKDKPICDNCGINDSICTTESNRGILRLCDICLKDETKGLPLEYMQQEADQEVMYENLMDGNL